MGVGGQDLVLHPPLVLSQAISSVKIQLITFYLRKKVFSRRG